MDHSLVQSGVNSQTSSKIMSKQELPIKALDATKTKVLTPIDPEVFDRMSHNKTKPPTVPLPDLHPGEMLSKVDKYSNVERVIVR